MNGRILPCDIVCSLQPLKCLQNLINFSNYSLFNQIFFFMIFNPMHELYIQMGNLKAFLTGNILPACLGKELI